MSQINHAGMVSSSGAGSLPADAIRTPGPGRPCERPAHSTYRHPRGHGDE
jgi:hypothetical protein